MQQPHPCPCATPGLQRAHVPQPLPDTVPRPEPDPALPPRPLDIPEQIPPEIHEPVLPGEHSPVGEPPGPVVPAVGLH